MTKEFDDFSEKVLQGIRKAYRLMLEEAKLRNDYIVVSKDGKVVQVPARDIPTPE